MQRTKRVVSSTAAETGWTRGLLLEGTMTWPGTNRLPFIDFETVWRVYELSDTGSNPTKTLKSIVYYKDDAGNNRFFEYLSFPSNVASATFAASTGFLGFEKDTSFANPVPLTGSGSLHTASVSAFGPQYKRFKATVPYATTYNNANNNFPWGDYQFQQLGRGDVFFANPQFDPGTWCIVRPDGGAYVTLAGVRSKLVSGPAIPTSGNPRNVNEAMIVVSGNSGADPATKPSDFRAYRTADQSTNPTQDSEYANNIKNGEGGLHIWPFDGMTVSSTWN